MKYCDVKEFHPNLERCFDGEILDHPYVRQLSPNPEYANEIYHSKKTQIEQAIRTKDWPLFVFLHERPYRPEALMTSIKKYNVPLDQLWPLIGDVWSDTEFPMYHASFWRKIWTSACPHRNTVMEPEDRARFDALPGEFVVWRGVNDADSISGFSWSLDWTIGVFFARRFANPGRPPILVQGFLKRQHAVASFDVRKEAEIVALPECVSVIGTQVLTISPGDNPTK